MEFSFVKFSTAYLVQLVWYKVCRTWGQKLITRPHWWILRCSGHGFGFDCSIPVGFNTFFLYSKYLWISREMSWNIARLNIDRLARKWRSGVRAQLKREWTLQFIWVIVILWVKIQTCKRSVVVGWLYWLKIILLCAAYYFWYWI